MVLGATVVIVCAGALAVAQDVSWNGAKPLSPPGRIKPFGTWNLGMRAGDFVFVLGMRGIGRVTGTLIQGDEARIRQAFLNIKLIANLFTIEGIVFRRHVGYRPGRYCSALRVCVL